MASIAKRAKKKCDIRNLPAGSKEATCRICGKTADVHRGLSGYILVTPDHKFTR